MLKKKTVVKDITTSSPKTKAESNTFKVYLNGDFVREYTTEFHGEYAENLAIQFAGKINGEVK